MLNTKELISEMVSLPVDIRAMLASRLLESLNHPDPSIDAEWAKVAEQRVSKIKSGEVKTIPGDQVFRKIQNKMKK
ncbi:addiction module protein [Lentisphaera profundi]|uniref:Addiction module protein n=1 Tax=Lentisphaera profundi TaxID=1658616 RepID=A0ABY7VWA1_9BACT|nr:addiction module protein [Lentisphaera profundi]WDE97167.1 addiction module protein [Lentisphaera profundi]